MEEEEILKKLAEQEQKISLIYDSVEKTRKYFLWMMIVTVAMIIIPIIGLIFVIPQFLNIYSGSGLGL
jgi:type II secretory pathway component PulF